MMEEKDPDSHPNRGMPEAINPEIANLSAWENDPHNLNLRLPDPAKSYDDLLLSDADKSRVISLWSSPMMDPNSLPPIQKQEEVPLTIDDQSGKKKRKDRKIFSSTNDKDPLPEWIEKMEDGLVLKEDPHGPTEDSQESDIIPDAGPVRELRPEGKRVKKAIKKAKKELEKSKTSSPIRLPSITESTLSPFTSWLKSLRGSEYVHPYEDDYGLGQQREGISETLADLLAAQGYKDQAVEMYSELMAKYPEKSSFFAAKIEALK